MRTPGLALLLLRKDAGPTLRKPPPQGRHVHRPGHGRAGPAVGAGGSLAQVRVRLRMARRDGRRSIEAAGRRGGRRRPEGREPMNPKTAIYTLASFANLP